MVDLLFFDLNSIKIISQVTIDQLTLGSVFERRYGTY